MPDFELDLTGLEDKWTMESPDYPICALCGKQIGSEDPVESLDGPDIPIRVWKGPVGRPTHEMAFHIECAKKRMKPPKRKCVFCGCTDDRACEGGCSWVWTHPKEPIGVCSSCQGRQVETEQKYLKLSEDTRRLMDGLVDEFVNDPVRSAKMWDFLRQRNRDVSVEDVKAAVKRLMMMGMLKVEMDPRAGAYRWLMKSPDGGFKPL